MIPSTNKKTKLYFILGIIAEIILLLLLVQAWQVMSPLRAVKWLFLNKKVALATFIFLSFFLLSLWSIIGRFWTANTLFLISVLLFGFINHEKMIYRQEPFLPSDIALATNAGEVTNMISIWLVILIVVCILMLISFTIWLERKHPIKFSNSLLVLGVRLLSVICMVFIVTGFFQINSQNTLANKISRAFDIDPDFWDPVTGAKRNGPIMLFASNLQVTVMDKPNDYSEAKIKSIVQRYKKESKKINIHRKNKNINKQTLIYILSESFSNPSRVPNMSVNKNPIQNILTTKQSSTSGLMLSSGYGGGTANMEYMTDTSLNLPFFASSLTVPFTQLVPNQDYVPSSTFFNVGTQFTVIQVVFTDGHRFIKNLVFKRSKILRAQEKIN